MIRDEFGAWTSTEHLMMSTAANSSMLPCWVAREHALIASAILEEASTTPSAMLDELRGEYKIDTSGLRQSRTSKGNFHSPHVLSRAHS